MITLSSLKKAALFSAVIAQFLGQATTSLQPDFTATAAALLTESVALQRAAISGQDIQKIPRSSIDYNSPVMPSSRDLWINGLWFVSLFLTLSTALVAGMVLQWLNFYVADITGGTSKDVACTRHYRFVGMNKWNVPAIIESLPVLMNTSLFFFLAGLVLFCQDLSATNAITWLLVALSLILLVVYCGTGLVPVWDPQCPYKTSLSKAYTSVLFVVHRGSIWLVKALEEVETDKAPFWVRSKSR